MLIGCGSQAERTGLQPAHVQQVVDQPGQPVQRLADGGQQLVPVGVAERHVAAAQPVDRGLRRGERRTQVVAHGRQQRRAQLVHFGQRSDRGRLLGQPFLAQRDRRLGRERLHHPAIRGGQRMPAQHQRERVVDRDVGAARRRA